jgi:hypothetical protein
VNTNSLLERSPEVFHVLNEKDKTGMDAFVDVHGDEILPSNFIIGNEGLWNNRLQALNVAYWRSITPFGIALPYCRMPTFA